MLCQTVFNPSVNRACECAFVWTCNLTHRLFFILCIVLIVPQNLYLNYDLSFQQVPVTLWAEMWWIESDSVSYNYSTQQQQQKCIQIAQLCIGSTMSTQPCILTPSLSHFNAGLGPFSVTFQHAFATLLYYFLLFMHLQK